MTSPEQTEPLVRDQLGFPPPYSVLICDDQPELRQAIAAALSDLVDGRLDPREVAKRLGDLGVAKVRQQIDDSPAWADALADSTVERKGHDHPLVETGTLYDAVSWDCEITDAGQVPREFLIVDTAALRAKAKTEKESFAVPGCKAVGRKVPVLR